ncbi:MAG TPA: PAS domain S-box protein [Chthoniobacterales bacterium]|nr:PAS domain S-box protein [Chthoniobacterales bacterium]
MRSEAKLKGLLKEVIDLKAALDEHAIVAITDPQGKITYVNDKFCAISKYSREELLGQDHRLINSGFHPAEFIRDLWTTIAGGKVWHGEIMNRAKDGSFYWVDTTIVPFLNEQGKPRQYVAIRADITERKRAEEAVARLAAIVESSDDAIIGKDLQGIVTSWNAGAEKEFGYTASEMIGHSITRLIPPERRDEEIKTLDQIRCGESVGHFETVRVGKDGKALDVSVAISAIRDRSGKIVGASKVVRDMTEKRRAEEALRQLNANLEQRVVERTIQLEAANKDLESFSYSVSHDLRAPLRAISGFSRIVREDHSAALDADGVRYLGLVEKSALQMGQLIDDLLTFSRTGRQALTVQTVNTAELVSACLTDLQEMREHRHVTITVGALPDCEADASLLRQVWLNLLANALKYTRKRDQAVITIGSQREGDTDSYFVQDNGAGFEMKYADKLFGVFQRLHLSDDYEGTGVGLALVQRIVQRHGGRVWAEANLNLGATFHFTLTGGRDD